MQGIPVIINALDQNSNKEHTPFVYLHGKLEEDNNFDLCQVINLPKLTGVYSALVNIGEETRKAKLYFWFPGHNQPPKGLVVDIDDNSGNSTALDKYLMKSNYV